MWSWWQSWLKYVRGLRIGHPKHYTTFPDTGVYAYTGQNATLTYTPGIDNTPNQFTFTDQTGVALSSTVVSAAVTISGLGSGVPITLNASGGTIDKNGDGSFLGSQIVGNGDTVRARVTASGIGNTPVSCVVVASPSGVADTFTATTVVVDYVPPGIISMANRSMAEGNSGTTNMVFTPTLIAAQARDVKLPYATRDGTATAPSDYTAVSGTLTILAGQTSGTISVPIIGDITVESDEAFSLDIINPYYV